MSAERTPAVIRRYLLGQSPEMEAVSLEEQYFQDEGVLQLVETIEHEMIEAYLDGEMPATERESFDRHYLASPVHRDRVRAIRALRQQAGLSSRATPPAPSWRNTLLPLAATILLAAGAVVWLTRSPHPRTPSPDHVPHVQSSPADPPSAVTEPETTPPTSTDRPPASPRVIVAFTIPAVVTRGADDATVRIPQDAREVLLRFEGEPAAPTTRARVTIRTVDGREVWSGTGEHAGRGVLTSVRVPVSPLEPDDYIVTVETGTRTERYSLRVRRP